MRSLKRDSALHLHLVVPKTTGRGATELDYKEIAAPRLAFCIRREDCSAASGAPRAARVSFRGACARRHCSGAAFRLGCHEQAGTAHTKETRHQCVCFYMMRFGGARGGGWIPPFKGGRERRGWEERYTYRVGAGISCHANGSVGEEKESAGCLTVGGDR